MTNDETGNPKGKKLLEEELGEPISVGGLYMKLKRFPRPNVEGLTADEAQAALESWAATIHAWGNGTEVKKQA